MSSRIHKDIVELAAKIHSLHWTPGSEESTQTKLAQRVCAQWQEAVKDNFQARFSVEHSVGTGMNERIDLVDLEAAIAYELKASPNNTHFEFYRDIFKVAVHNDRNPRFKISKLVFITPMKGADKLRSGFGDAVCSLAARHHSIEIEICGI